MKHLRRTCSFDKSRIILTYVTLQYLKTNVNNVYAGGDIAYAPIYGSDDVQAAIGHYPLAHYHGKVAASNICGKENPLMAVPFFWTNLFGRNYRYAGKFGAIPTSERHQTVVVRR